MVIEVEKICGGRERRARMPISIDIKSVFITHGVVNIDPCVTLIPVL